MANYSSYLFQVFIWTSLRGRSNNGGSDTYVLSDLNLKLKVQESAKVCLKKVDKYMKKKYLLKKYSLQELSTLQE